MSIQTASIKARHRIAGAIAYYTTLPLMRLIGRVTKFHGPNSRYAQERLASLREKLDRGETAYVLGIGPGGHDAGVSLLEVSRDRGIRVLCNHEEERFQAVKHYMFYPRRAADVLLRQMEQLGIEPEDIHCAVATFDYHKWSALGAKLVAEELPGSRYLLKQGAVIMTGTHVVEAFKSPWRLGRLLRGGERMPVLNVRHHDSHAYFTWGVSPFAQSEDPVIVLVVDGAGDDAAISHYVVRDGQMELLYTNDNSWDSLGMMYGMLSSVLGGWPFLHSEGRFMGAAAWGDCNRMTNPYYSQLREIFHLGGEGKVFLNRTLARWHRKGFIDPFTPRLKEILGEPIPPEEMWNPDAVLNVDNIQHADITQQRVDKAAAVQLIFEDALFHIVNHLIRKTGASKMVLTGGAALNCVANMRVMEEFDEQWYQRNLGQENTRLNLWVPPTPNDEGMPIGAAYQFACLAGAKPGEPFRHAFYCGLPPTRDEIVDAYREVDEIDSLPLGNISEPDECDRIADLLAYIVSQNGVVGLFQGAAETGPRALGHRSILADPSHPKTLETLNSLVKFRERIRPLAPMATLDAAHQFFRLSEGASADDYNAYNYMVLTAKARPEAYEAIPAVIHHDGTGRVQIVRPDVDPFCHAYLQAMGRYIGAEVSVNTSLNVGAPIAQTAVHALETLKKSKGMHGLFMIADNGDVFVAWHNIEAPPKDAGRQIRQWIKEWEGLDGQAQPPVEESLPIGASESESN